MCPTEGLPAAGRLAEWRRLALPALLIVAGPGAGYLGYHVQASGRGGAPATAALPPGPEPSPRLVREQALVLPPAGGLKGTLSRQELYRALLFVEPQWRVSKTTNLLHALRLWGADARFDEADMPNPFRTEPPSGGRMLEVLLDMKKFAAAGVGPTAFLYRSGHGVQTWNDTRAGGGVAHVDQFLMVTGELGLRADRPIRLVDGSWARLEDAVLGSLAVFSPEAELEFSAVAYSRWLPPAREWLDRFGRRHSLDDVCRTLARQSPGEGACAGTHVPYALVNLLRAHEVHPVLSAEAVRLAEDRLREVARLLEANPAPAGGWYEDWHRSDRPRAGTTDPTFQLIVATGHHLEWIALAPERLRPARPAVARAARLLAWLIPRHSINTVANTYPPFTHAARALALLEECDPAAVLRSPPRPVPASRGPAPTSAKE